MLTIDNKLQQIYGIRALASVSPGPGGVARPTPAISSPAPLASIVRPEATGRKGST